MPLPGLGSCNPWEAVRSLNNLGSIWVISGIKLTYKWVLKFERFLSWRQQACRWRMSPPSLRGEIMSPGGNRFPRSSAFVSGEGRDLSKTSAFSQSEQYWSVTGAQEALAAYLCSSEKWTEFVAVGKEPRDLGLPAAVEILLLVFPCLPSQFPLKFCVYTHPLDSFAACKQRNTADKPHPACTSRFLVF